MLLVQEENGLFGSLGTWPLSVQILSSLHILTCFYLQPFQLSPRKYCWEQGREETKARTKLEKGGGGGGGEATASSLHCFRQQVSWKWKKVFWPRVFYLQSLKGHSVNLLETGSVLMPSRRCGGIGEGSWPCLSWFLLLSIAAAAVPGSSMPSPALSFISRAMGSVLGGLKPVASGVSLAVHRQDGQMSSIWTVVQQ